MRGVASEVAAGVRNFALAYIGLRALESAFAATVQTAKDLTNESARMGVTVEQLQVMRKAASNAGVEVDKLASAMDKLNEFRAKALKTGSPEAMLANMQAAQLGITPAMLRNDSAQSIMFGAVAAKIKSVNPQEIAAPLKEIFGRSAGEIVPLLKTDMAGLEKSMKSFGQVMSNETARDLNQVSQALTSVKIGFTNALAPAIVGLVEMFLDVIISGGTLSKAFHDWAEWIGQTIALSNNSYKTQSGQVIPAKQRADAATAMMKLMDATLSNVRKANPNLSPEDVEKKAFDEITGFLKSKEYQVAVNKSNLGTAASYILHPITSMISGDGQHPLPTKQEFEDFKGSTYKELSTYMNGLQQGFTKPVTDASNTAGDLVKSLKAARDEMNKPAPDATKPPDFTAAAQMTKQRMSGQGDKMIEVGNFLGASRGVIGGAQARLEHHAAQTAQNTTMMLKLLDKIVNNTSSTNGFGDMITNGGLSFPP